MANNVIIPSDLKVPAHLANRLSQPSSLGTAMSGGISEGVSIPRISLKGSRFRIIEGGAEMLINTLDLDVIIVGANPGLSKLWYEGQWSPDSEPGAPDCHSLSGIRPEADSKKPQSDNCASCPQNQWGSKITPQGQKIKACADQKRLAVVAASDPTGPIYLLQVTPAALKGLNQYHKELSVRGIPAEVVITKLSFDASASFPKLMFKFGGFLDEHTQAQVDDLFGSSAVHDVTGESSSPQAITLQIEKPNMVRADKPKPVIIEAQVEEVVAPPTPATPKRGFGANTTVTAPPVQAAPPKRVVAEPPAATTTTSNALMNDISKLLEDMDDEPEAT